MDTHTSQDSDTVQEHVDEEQYSKTDLESSSCWLGCCRNEEELWWERRGFE